MATWWHQALTHLTWWEIRFCRRWSPKNGTSCARCSFMHGMCLQDPQLATHYHQMQYSSQAQRRAPAPDGIHPTRSADEAQRTPTIRRSVRKQFVIHQGMTLNLVCGSFGLFSLLVFVFGSFCVLVGFFSWLFYVLVCFVISYFKRNLKKKKKQ